MNCFSLRPSRPILMIGTLALMFSAAIAARGQEAARPDPALKTQIIEPPPVHLDRIYPAMTGPVTSQPVRLYPDAAGEPIWVRRFRVEVLDAEGRPDSPEFMCHSTMSWQSEAAIDEVFSVSQGHEEMLLPDGFGIPVAGDLPLTFEAMAENNSYPSIDKTIRFRATVDYLENQDAKARGLRPLETLNLLARPANFVAPGEQPGELHHHAGMPEHDGMWMVPPGRHTYRADLPDAVSFDGTIHFIKMHLHPFAESISLIDRSSGETLWVGRAQNHEDKRWLTDTDHYSDEAGLPLHGSHDYQLEVVYDNPTPQDIDAMGVLRTYVARNEPLRTESEPVWSRQLARCEAMVETGFFEAAQTACLEALALDIEDVASRRRLGTLLVQAGLRDQGAELLFAGTDLSPEQRRQILDSIPEPAESGGPDSSD